MQISIEPHASATKARSAISSSRNPRKPNIPPANLNPAKASPDRPRPRRVFDARSLAASQSGDQSAKILRTPKLKTARPGQPSRARKARTPTKSASPKDRKTPRHRASRQSDAEEGDEVQRMEIEQVYRDLTEERKQSPSRYTPQPPDMSSLTETWPSFPTGIKGHAAGIMEKLSLLSDRSPNGYVPPYELGRRLFKGQYVRFLDETEKSEAVAEAQKLSQQRADEYSQRKGDLVEPDNVSFHPVSGQTQKALIKTFVFGDYLKEQPAPSNETPVLREISRHLKNNETYQTTGKSSQFTGKVEALLGAGRPGKRG